MISYFYVEVLQTYQCSRQYPGSDSFQTRLYRMEAHPQHGKTVILCECLSIECKLRRKRTMGAKGRRSLDDNKL